MDLVGRDQMLWRGAELFGNAAAVFQHVLAVVTGTKAHVEAFVDAGGDTAFAGEEAM